MSRAADQAEFVNLLISHQRRLFGYIATLLPNPAHAEEVFQQTNLVLWSKAEEFEPGTSFRAWSFRVAYLEVLAFQRRNAREKQLFDSVLVETISAELEEFDSEPTAQGLQTCLEKLSVRDRDLVTQRYTLGATVKQLADAQDRPASSVYRSLDRIRYWLLRCVQRFLVSEKHP